MLKFNDVVTKTDWIKMGILLVVAVSCWIWVYREYQKPIIPEEWEQEIVSRNSPQ